MPSQDLLEKLFEVERKAEALVVEARAEANKRVGAARTNAQIAYSEALATAARETASGREAGEEAVRAEYRALLDAYSQALEGTRRDEAEFIHACEAALSEME